MRPSLLEPRIAACRGGADECWIWPGPLTDKGYAQVQVNKKPLYVHRLLYEREIGPIPDGLELDHLCRNSACVNPAHLEPVSHRENVLRGTGASARHARQTHCREGHPFDSANTKIGTRGDRICITCSRESKKLYERRKRAQLSISRLAATSADVGVQPVLEI